jgi:UDP-N-acetylglucosamine--N-acetylmuramyl-(pentapeptide) pyrophosphoryl-undecaprenol N-acetylglucosamine transferase
VSLLFASVLLRKKIVLYEANRSMGKVTRLFTPFAKKIAVQFVHQKKSKREKSKQVQVPLFPWIVKERVDKLSALQTYGLDPTKKTFLIFGGSQGAQFLNETMPNVSLQGQVIHLAGNEQAAKQTAENYAKLGIIAVVKSFESNMGLAYAAADFAVCRSGAGTVAELIRYGVPALLIPYPYAYGHQEINADYLKDFGGAKILLQRDATPEAIRKEIERCDLFAMRVALRSLEAQNQSLMGLDEVVRRCSNKSI